MRSKPKIGVQTVIPFTSKKTRQGNGLHSKPRKGKKKYRGQGK
jgi:hypothetical protein